MVAAAPASGGVVRVESMALYVPEPIEDAWRGVLESAVQRRIDGGAVGAIVERMSRSYRGEDVSLPPADAIAARALFWFPRDVVKIALPIAELVASGTFGDRALRVLDLGAGLGATSLGVARVLDAIRARGGSCPTIESIDAVDADARALDAMRAIADGAFALSLLRGAMPSIRAHTLDLARPLPRSVAMRGPFDLIVSGLTLVELTRAASDDLSRASQIASTVRRWVESARLRPDGAIVLLEPGTHDDARALHGAREALSKDGWHILAPCPHALACPMLVRERDWCHEDLPVDLPPWLVPVAREAGLRWQGATFSYLTLTRTARRSTAVGSRVRARVVSSPRISKGKCEAFACGAFGGDATGLRLMQLSRDARGTSVDEHVAPTVTLNALARGDEIDVDVRGAQPPATTGATFRVGVEALARALPP